MRGSIVKKGSTYSIIVDIGKDSKGKRKQKWFSGYKTKKEAQKALTAILSDLDNNTFINPDKTTLSEYLNQWLTDYAEKRLAPKTVEGYKVNLLRHVIPSLGQVQLSKLQPIQIQRLYNEKLANGRLDGKGGLSAKSVIYIHRVLRLALSHAYKMQLIPRNVADFVEVPRAKTFQAGFLNEIQIQQLLTSIKDTEIYIAVLLGVGLGLRRGEALGLQWKDINFNNNTINISRSLLPTKNGLIFHSPKTKNSERILVASSFIIQELQALKEKQNQNKALLGDAYTDNDLVCCLNDGSPMNPASFSHTFSRALKKYKLELIRFHDLRHTNATLMLKSNVPAKVASERLGHSSIGITLDLYSHVMKEMQEEAANKINLIFKNN